MAERIPTQWLRGLLGHHGGLPRAPGLPLIGSLPAVALRQFDFFDEARERCGDIFEVDVGLTKIVIVAAPELAAEVLLDRPKNFDKGEEFWEGVRDLLGNGLPVSDGEFWRRQRRLMNPQFRRDRIAGFTETIHATVDELVRELDGPAARGETVEISEWAAKLLATLTLRLLFGAEFDVGHLDDLRAALTVMLDQIISGMVVRKLPSWVPVAGAGAFEQARQVIDDQVLGIIAERRRSAATGEDLLGLLLAATDEGDSMTDQQLRDEVVSVYLAGFETTAWTLSWALWVLADHQEVVRALQAELDGEDDPLKIPLLRATVDEVTRLYPSAPFLPRRATVDESLGGHPIPAGTTVVFSPWLIHRNPAVWPDPLRFDPSRHLGEHPERHRLALMPFGAGQRICIGKGLAQLEANIALGAVLRRFTPLPGAGPRAQPRLSTTLRSRDGIRIRLRPRAAP